MEKLKKNWTRSLLHSFRK